LLFFKNQTQKGQSLIEVLVALGVFVVGVVAIGFLVIDASISFRQANERTQAILLAKEGLEASRSIRDADFDNLTPGLHGIALSDNKWLFLGSLDVQDQFTRIINITDVDADIKKIESTISWQFTEARQNSVSLITYLTDWNQTQGKAGDLLVDITSATLSGDNKELQGLTIENSDNSDIVIDKMTVWWNNSSLLSRIRIDDIDVFNVSSSDGVSSGTEIDITNFTLTQGSGIKNINTLRFSEIMTGSDFTIKFIMTDNSTKYILVCL